MHRAVGGKRRAVIRAVLAQSDRNENVLNGDQSRAQIRGQRDREGDPQHAIRHARIVPCRFGTQVFFLVEEIKDQQVKEGQRLRDRRSENQGKRTVFDAAGQKRAQERNGQRDLYELLRYACRCAFINAANRVEITGKYVGKRDEGQCNGKNAQ